MGAAKRKRGFLVTEVRKAANRLPSCLGVAALAAKFEVTVRAARGSALGRLRNDHRRQGGEKGAKANLRESPAPHGTRSCSRLGEGTEKTFSSRLITRGMESY